MASENGADEASASSAAAAAAAAPTAALIAVDTVPVIVNHATNLVVPVVAMPSSEININAMELNNSSTGVLTPAMYSLNSLAADNANTAQTSLPPALQKLTTQNCLTVVNLPASSSEQQQQKSSEAASLTLP